MKDLTATTRRLLAFSMLRGVGPATLRKIASIKNFEQIEPIDLADKIVLLRRALADSDAWDNALRSAESQEEQAHAQGVRILSSVDTDYPGLLHLSTDDPFIIYVKGHLAPVPSQSVAVIGTRQATDHGLVIADRITKFFVEKNWSIVSGLALGCDAQAHRSAIEVNGHTVAVLAHGLQTIAPTQHKGLAAEILDAGGALVSQFPMGNTATPRQFASRDKTQAGLSQGVVLVQSGCTGGSMIASRKALKYGRWLAVPYPTAKDEVRDIADPKFQANLVLCEGTQDEKLELLQLTDEQALRRLIIVRDKGDYETCLDQTDRSMARDATSPQTNMF